ncbi:MAG: folate-binding protein YgfZ [Myxococcales bacterium]|nr:folate-binding protein YgfZ [Myxococcales bacterium]
MLVDCSAWGHLAVTGGDRLRFLHGLTTVNVTGLADGGHAWGAILSPKGRVLSVVEITREPERVLVHVEPALVEPTLAVLDKYAVMDDVVSAQVPLAAHKRWASAADAWRAPYVFAPPPGPVAGADELEVARIEAGLLRYGVDVDDGCFPFETPLAAFLDYGKGCYVGQEPVFRVHAQGQGARTLRGLRVDGDTAPPVGATVAHPAKASAGAVTSATVSPRLGPIALAYLHRSAWTVGDEVTVDGRRATVVELPADSGQW